MLLRSLPAAVALFAGAALGASVANAAALHADSAHSIAGFSIKHLAITSVQGTMKIVSVAMSLQPHSVVPESVDAVIDVNSVNTANSDRDNDLRSQHWFDVAQFPTMHFVCTRVERSRTPNAFRAFGTLTFHGASKDVVLDVAFTGDARDEHGLHHYGYTATTTLDRRDFGLDALEATPGGNLLVGTSVTVNIELDMVDPG